MQRIVFSSQGILAISQRVNFCPLGPPPPLGSTRYKRHQATQAPGLGLFV